MHGSGLWPVCPFENGPDWVHPCCLTWPGALHVVLVLLACRYLEVFGMAIDSKLKSGVLSVILTAVAAGLSALISISVRFYA